MKNWERKKGVDKKAQELLLGECDRGKGQGMEVEGEGFFFFLLFVCRIMRRRKIRKRHCN